MIFFLAVWVLMAMASLLAGLLLLAPLRVSIAARPGDRALLALWTGFLSLNVLFLALALATPLTALLLAGMMFLLGLAVTAVPPARLELRSLLSHLTPSTGLQILLLAALAALVSIQRVSNRDAISYHFDIVYYLSRIGITPGLALVHERLGYVSSWFVFPAIFNHGPLSGRPAVVANGFALLLLLVHMYLSFRRLCSGRSRPLDLYMFVSVPAAVTVPLLLNYSVSTTPDFAIAAVPVIIAWTLLMLAGENVRPADPEKRGMRRQELVPLFLAACLFTTKIVAAPALAVCFILYLVRQRKVLKSFLVGAGCVLVVTLPLTVGRSLLSGCPLDPIPVCFDLPWTIGRDKMPLEKFFSIVWRLYYDPSAQVNTLKVFAVFAALLLLSAAAVLLFRKMSTYPLWPVAAFGLTGLAALLLFAPTPRFAWGYMAVLISLPALLVHRNLSSVLSRCHTFFSRQRTVAALGFAGIFLYVIVCSHLPRTTSENRLGRAFGEGILQEAGGTPFLLPPIIPKIHYDDEKGVALPLAIEPGIIDPLPDEARSMYYPLVPSERATYRDPGRGVSGGFRKSRDR